MRTAPARRLSGLLLPIAAAAAACAPHPAAGSGGGHSRGVNGDRQAPATAAAPVAGHAAAPVAGRAAGAVAGHAAASTPPAAADAISCRPRAFPLSLPVPEASGAALFPPAGGNGARLLVVADSDNRGAMIEVDPASGHVLASEHLPLDHGASDDLEGLSVHGDRIYVLASSGWMRSFRRARGRWVRVGDAYPIAARGSGLLCRSPHRTNCNKNFEGLCLRPQAAVPTGPGRCAGFAVAKGNGTLYCMVFDRRGRLRADPGRRIRVARPKILAGCAFSPDGARLLVGANVFAFNAVYRIRNWRDPAHARAQRIGLLGIGNSEAIALGPGGALFRLSDTNSAPSLARAYVCRRSGGAPAW